MRLLWLTGTVRIRLLSWLKSMRIKLSCRRAKGLEALEMTALRLQMETSLPQLMLIAIRLASGF